MCVCLFLLPSLVETRKHVRGRQKERERTFECNCCVLEIKRAIVVVVAVALIVYDDEDDVV